MPDLAVDPIVSLAEARPVAALAEDLCSWQVSPRSPLADEWLQP
jgi:hypothetical protein